jgi:tetrahydromethanopterin S-methyltransferase subunit G
MSFENEKYWHEKGQEDKAKALNLRIREFEELTLRHKLLDKVVEKSTDEKVTEIEKNLKDLQRKYESLNGEIEQIIIKKKQ